MSDKVYRKPSLPGSADRIRAILPRIRDSQASIREGEDSEGGLRGGGNRYGTIQDHVARMVDDNEITRNAMKVGRYNSQAEQVAQDIRRDADDYADGLLSHMEIVLKKGLMQYNRVRKLETGIRPKGYYLQDLWGQSWQLHKYQ